MRPTFTRAAQRLGVVSAWSIVALSVAYGVVLVIGLATLPSPDAPISGGLFAAMELLILCLAPAMVALMVAIHAWAEREQKVVALLALAFTSLVSALTCSLHFVILAVGHHPEFATNAVMARLLSFTWPSVGYALDILAWDVFFAWAVGTAALVFRGDGDARIIRWLLMASGLLAFAGLSGVVLDDMRWRNLGIVGYGAVFPVAAFFIARLLGRTSPVDA